MRKESKKRIAKVFAVLTTALTITLCIWLPMSAIGTVSTPTTYWNVQGQTTIGYEYMEANNAIHFVTTNKYGNPWLPVGATRVGMAEMQLSRDFLYGGNRDLPPNGYTYMTGTLADPSEETGEEIELSMNATFEQDAYNTRPFTNKFSEEEHICVSASDVGQMIVYPYMLGNFDFVTLNINMRDMYSWYETTGGVGGQTSQRLILIIPSSAVVHDIYTTTENGYPQTKTEPMIKMVQSSVTYRALENYDYVYEEDVQLELEETTDGDIIIVITPPKPTNATRDSVYEIESLNVRITTRILSGLDELPIEYRLDYTTRTDISNLRYEMIKATKYELPPIVDMTEWLGESVSAFMNFQLVEGITLGGVFTVLIGFSVVMWLLKMFAGG